MVNINLSTIGEEDTKKEESYNIGTILILSVVVILVLACGGVYIWKNDINKRIASAKEEYKENLEKLNGNEYSSIVDFQIRLDIAESSLEEKNLTDESFNQVEQNLIPGIRLEGYNFNNEERIIKIEGVTSDYEILAKQVLSFKKTDYFSGVSIGKTELNKNGEVEFPIILSISR